MISLRDITVENADAVVDFTVPGDAGLVAPNELSIVESLLRDDAWLRAIYVDDTPVGLVMVQDIPDWHIYAIWRLMVGTSWRGSGFGREAMEQVIERYQRRPGAHMLTTSVAEHARNAEEFYQKLGFVRDGRRQMGQIGMALGWAEPIDEDEWPSVPADADVTLEIIRSGMLQTVKRAYLSLPEDTRAGLETPLITIMHSRLDESKDKAKAICANGYPVGFAVCDAQDASVRATYIALPYQGMGIETGLM
jgi:diamine N-acetyltransferase